MSVTLTFFKRKGDKQSDIFRGTNDGPGSAPSQWELLTRDKDLKDAGLKFLVVEYVNTTDLPVGYERKVQRTPYIDLRWNEDVRNSVAYPGRSPLSLFNIKTWTLEVIEDFKTRAETPTQPPELKETTQDLVASATSDAAVRSTEVATDGSPSWLKPVVLTTSFAALAFAAVVGTGLDKKIAKWARHAALDNRETVPFYDAEGQPVTTPDMQWTVIDVDTEQSLLPSQTSETVEEQL